MPIYEYHCAPCDHDFETLVRSPRDVPRCPRCGESEGLQKQFSVPASARVEGGGGSAGQGAPLPMMGGCGMGGCGGGMCGME